MRVSGVFAMGGVRGNNWGGYDYGYPYYPDNGRWTYYYYQGYGYVGHFGYGYSRSRGLLRVEG